MKRYVYWDERWPVFFLEETKPQTMFSTKDPVDLTEEEPAEGERAAAAYFDWQEKLRVKADYDA